MNKQISSKTVSLVFAILVICFAIGFYAIGWEEPVAPPPGGDVPAPLNTGNVGQGKIGGLALNTGPDGIISSDGAANGLLIYDGNVGIGDATPDSGTGGQLKLDVDGPVGATKYCDENGDNCKTITDVGVYTHVNCSWVESSYCGTRSGAWIDVQCSNGKFVAGIGIIGCTGYGPTGGYCDDDARCQKPRVYCCGL